MRKEFDRVFGTCKNSAESCIVFNHLYRGWKETLKSVNASKSHLRSLIIHHWFVALLG